eukprot:12336218-Heterocapsa_arctica.AAC.1
MDPPLRLLRVKTTVGQIPKALEDIAAFDEELTNSKPTGEWRVNRRKAVINIGKAARSRITIEISNTKPGMKGNVQTIMFIPKGVGQNQTGNLEGIIYQAFKLARTKMPKDSDIMAYAYLKFPSKNGEPFEVRSETVTISKTDGKSGYGDVEAAHGKGQGIHAERARGET